MDLTAEEHIRVQAAIQKWVDSSISKTANAPADFTVEDTKKLYEYAFDLGCKGVTIYRDGSRDTQVLSVEKEDKKAEDKSEKAKIEKEYRTRPKKLSGATYKMNTPFGKAYITVNDLEGKPFEIMINVGKAGSDVFAMSEALGRVSTLFLRFGELPDGNKARLLIKHLKGIGGSGAVGFGTNRVESIADAVAKALEIHMNGENSDDSIAATLDLGLEISKTNNNNHSHNGSKDGEGFPDGLDLCPTCGSASLVNEEGCKHCLSCGYTKCT